VYFLLFFSGVSLGTQRLLSPVRFVLILACPRRVQFPVAAVDLHCLVSLSTLALFFSFDQLVACTLPFARPRIVRSGFTSSLLTSFSCGVELQTSALFVTPGYPTFHLPWPRASSQSSFFGTASFCLMIPFPFLAQSKRTTLLILGSRLPPFYAPSVSCCMLLNSIFGDFQELAACLHFFLQFTLVVAADPSRRRSSADFLLFSRNTGIDSLFMGSFHECQCGFDSEFALSPYPRTS